MSQIPSVKMNLRCPHCGNVAPQEVVFTHRIAEEEDSGWYAAGEYYLAVCVTCNDLSLYGCMDYQSATQKPSFYEASLIYPKPKTLPEQVVPRGIIKTYEEALKIKNITPTLFAMQIGKALEYLCKDKKAEGDNLIQQINFLSKQGIIPPTLTEMTEILRLFRNIAAHVSDKEITAYEATIIDDFFNLIIEYVYIASHKINHLKEAMAKKEKKS